VTHQDQDDLRDAREALAAALVAEDKTERMLRIVAAVQSALADTGLRPVIVGGLAVEYWTGSYSTADIDVLLPTHAVITHRLEALGFVRHGRVWELPGHDVIWEMPASELDELDHAVEVAVPNARVLVLALEDILVHRIEEFVATGHLDVARQAVALIMHPRLDRQRLQVRADACQQGHAVNAIEELATRAGDGEQFETGELHDLAHSLRAKTRGT
jgi:hypothetical protein